MQLPFQIIANFNSGSSSQPLDHLSLLPSRALNAANTQVAVNAANGKVLVEDTLFSIDDLGSTLKLGMVWNSSDKNWRFAYGPQIKFTNTLIARATSWLSTQETLTLVEADGRELQYTKDKSGAYICTSANSQGLSFIVRNTASKTLERTHPASGIKEIFSLDGLLRKRIYPDNSIYSFVYDANQQLQRIDLPSGRQITLTPNQNKSVFHLNLITNGKEKHLADYVFDANKNLSTYIFNADQSYHKTTYQFANQQLQIASDDATSAAITLDASGSATGITEGKRAWTLSLDKKSKVFSIKNAENPAYTVTLDANDALAELQIPEQKYGTVYQCNAMGQPATITLPDQTQEQCEYSTSLGLLTKKTRSTRYSQNVYNDKDRQSPLFGVKLAEIKGEGNLRTAKFFIYNNHRQLIYEVSAEGRLTRYFYAPLDPNKPSPSVLVATKKSTSMNGYPLSRVNLDKPTTYPTEAELDAYWNDHNKVPKNQLQVTTFSYDAFGRCDKEMRYTHVDANGDGIQNATTAIIKKRFDEKGLTRECAIAVSDKEWKSTTSEYDGLNRLTAKDENLARLTTYRYQGNTTRIHHSGGLDETVIKDAGGLTASHLRTDSRDQAQRLEQYQRNPDGSVNAIITAAGDYVREIRDAQGRMQYRLLPGGHLEEYCYDLCGNLECTKTYSVIMPQPLQVADIPGLIAGDNGALRAYQLYDELGQLRFDIIVKRTQTPDEQSPSLKAFVTQHWYSLGNKIRMTHYAKPLLSADISQMTYQNFCPQVVALDHDNNPPPPLLNDNDPENRSTIYFYDKDDFIIGEQAAIDAKNGFLKKYERDGAGNITHEIVYKSPSPLSLNLSEATPAKSETLETFNTYDLCGRLKESRDCDNVVTSFTYYADGLLQSETVGYQVIRYEYDTLGRKSKITNSVTGLDIRLEYDSWDNEIARTLTDTKAIPPTVRQTRREYNAFGQVRQEASARVLDTKSPWVFHQYHPTNGLKLSTVDEKGQVTLFYYNRQQQPVLEISPLGAVKSYQYAHVCGKPTVICHYANRLTQDALKQLLTDTTRDGFYSSNLFNSILPIDPQQDQIATVTYDACGLAIREVAANQSVRTLFYNAFNQVVRDINGVGSENPLITDKTYDNRGNHTRTLQDPQGFAIITTVEFADPLNRPTAKTSALGERIETTYTGLRKQENKDAEDPSRLQTLTQDILMRPETATDWKNQIAVKHEYDDDKREHHLINPENPARNKVETLNAYGEVEKLQQGIHATQFEHGVDGQLEKTIFADGTSDILRMDNQGLLESHTNRLGTTTRLIRNEDQQVMREITGPDERTRQLTPDALGNNVEIISPAGITQTTSIQQAGLTRTQVIDPQGLGISSRETRNGMGGLMHIEQGSVDRVMYHEIIKRDALNREISREIDMRDKPVKVLKTQHWDNAGHLTLKQDGLGNTTRYCFDKRGNLRFVIDPEGFVTERQYDANNKEVMQREYVKPISTALLSTLNNATSPADLQKLDLADNQDAIRYRLYNKEGLPTFELHVLEQTKTATFASVREWRYAGSTSAYTQRIDYANPINLATCALRDVAQKLVANPLEDRVKDVCRDAFGRGVFTRNGEGYITEKRYNAEGVDARIRYADCYSTLNFSQDPTEIKKQLHCDNSFNRETYFLHDAYGNLRFTIDPEGFVKEYTYDADNHPLTTTSYYQKLAPMPAELNLADMIRCSSLLKSPKDVTIKQRYDAAGRHDQTIDGLGYCEEYQLNALGLVEWKKDKRKQQWIKQYDAAKQLEKDISPSVMVTQVNEDLTVAQRETSVENTYGYDDAFNQNSVDYASNIDSRKVTKSFDKKGQLIGTTIHNIKIDDGSSAPPTQDKRPVTESRTLTTARVLDYAGRELVTINERGHAQFTVYDPSGRERFLINREGYITEYVYHSAFQQANTITHHVQAFEPDALIAHQEKGFTLAEVAEFIAKAPADKLAANQTMTLTHDRCGLPRSATKDVIITSRVDANGLPQVEEIAPETRWLRNAFGEVISEDVVVDQSGKVARTQKFYDNNGNVISTISPRGFVTTFEYGMREIAPGKKGYILLSQKEYAKPITVNGLIQTSAYDREYRYDYDQRLLPIAITMTSAGDAFYEPKLDAQGRLVKGEGVHSLTFRTEYDAEGQIIAHAMPNGDKRYLQRDQRGDVIRETSLPKALDIDVKVEGQPKKVYSVTSHQINAHRQCVGSTAFINPIELNAVSCENGEVAITQSLANPAQDEHSLICMDARGNPIVTRHPNGQLQFATFDACSQRVRSYQWVSGYKQENGEIKSVKHLQAHRLVYDARDNISLQEKYDESARENPLCQTHKQFDAFNQCIAEGSSADKMQVKREFDKAANQIFTNEEGGKAKITFPNAQGHTAVEITSSTQDLNVYHQQQRKAVNELLAKNYEKYKDQFQRTCYQRDLEGNITHTHFPFYSHKPKEAPLYQSVCFNLVKQMENNVNKTFIQWQRPDEKFLQADFKIRCKGDTEWITLPDLQKEGIGVVDISVLPADTYEYQLDFYNVDPDAKPRSIFPMYRARGETVLDTGNYAESKHPVWYLKEKNQLVIGGKRDYPAGAISGVQLIDARGEVYKTLAGTEVGDRLIVDLHQEDSGNYAIKFVYSKPVVKDLTHEECKLYQPQFRFTGASSIQALPGTLPPELTLNALVTPCTIQWPITRYELGKDNFLQLIFLPSEPLSKANVSVLDANRESHDLGTFINNGIYEGIPGGSRMTYQFKPQPGVFSTPPFLWVKLADGEASALAITVAPNVTRLCQLEQAGNHTYKVALPPGFNAANALVQLVNLRQAPVSDVIGNIALRTLKKPLLLSAQEIDVNEFTIDHYQVVGCRESDWESSRDYGFNYKWKGNLPTNARLHISHPGVDKDIEDISELGPRPGGGILFQSLLGVNQSQEAGFIHLKVTINGDTLYLLKNAPPQSSQNYDRPEDIVENFAVGFIRQKHVSTAVYPNVNGIYLSPLPAGVASAYVEIRENTTVGKDVWVQPDFEKTANGILIRPSQFAPGSYQYRICLLDKDGKAIDVNDGDFKRDNYLDSQYPSSQFPKAVWSYGTLAIRKGSVDTLRFVSQNEQQIRETVRPVALFDHDRYCNPVANVTPENFAQAQRDQASDLTPYQEKRDYNLFDQAVRTTSPQGTWWDEQGVEHSYQAVRETFYNGQKAVVGNSDPVDSAQGAASHLAYVNAAGKTLMHQDADLVAVKSSYDGLDRTISTQSASSGKSTSTYERKEACLIEKRINADKTQEEFERNEKNQLIRHKDRLQRNSYSDFDMENHEILHINFDGASFSSALFDLRTGMQLEARDEDGNTQSWRGGNESDTYFGNCGSYTDMAGQVITYLLDFNKQLMEETGELNHVVKSRGVAISADENPPPPAKHIKYMRNEAGLPCELMDLGAKLVTRIDYNQDGYQDSYYFISADGKVYQATHTIYDKLHRIMQITDTRYVVHYGYDQNDNRRFARAYFAGDNVGKDNSYRESWYRYTRANRPLVRDGKLVESKISIVPGQGTAFTYGNQDKQDQVQMQENINSAGERREQELKYRPDNILADIITKNAATQAVISTVHREVDAALRLISSTQRGCDFKLQAGQPDRVEIAGYVIPTFVLSFMPLELHRYVDGADEKINIDDDESLKHALHAYKSMSYAQAKALEPLIVMALSRYHSKTYGDQAVDVTEYDNKTGGIRKQTHQEKNRYSERAVGEVYPSGLPKTETNISRYTIPEGKDKGKAVTTTTAYARDYAYGDKVQLAGIRKTGESIDAPKDYQVDDLHKTGELQSRFNANEDVVGVEGDLANGQKSLQESFRSFVVNSQQCMVYKQSGEGCNYYFYAQKRPGFAPVLMAYFGDLPDGIKSALSAKDRLALASTSKLPAVVNIDTNALPNPTQTMNMPSQYVTPKAMSYREIADALNYTGYELAIARANESDDPDAVVQMAVPVNIPPLYFNVSDTAWNGPSPDKEVMMGSMYPVTPGGTIKPKTVKVNWVEEFVEIAATVAVMALAPEAFGAMLGIALTGAQSTLAGSALVYGLAGATANAVGQGVEIGFGSQHGFNSKNFVTDAISSAISGGLMQKLGGASVVRQVSQLTPGVIATNVMRAEVVSVAQQAALLAARLQTHFDPRLLAAAAFNGVVNTAADAAFGPTRTPDGLPLPGAEVASLGLGQRVASAGVTSALGVLGKAGIYHQPLSVEGVAASSLGAMVGTACGDYVSDEIVARQEAAKRAEFTTQAHAVAKLGEHKAYGPTLFAKQKTGKRVDAVKENKLNNFDDSIPGLEDLEVTLNTPAFREQVKYGLTELNRARMQSSQQVQGARIADNEGFHAGTRALGALQAFAGGVQTVGSIVAGVLTAETGVGPLGFGILAAKGMDDFGTGVRQLLSGRDEHTVFVDVARSVGASRVAANVLDVGLDLAGTAGELAVVSRLGMYGRVGGAGVENVAHNAVQYQALKANLRQNMEKPLVSDPELQNFINKLYRPNATVGSGSTADAVREELRTGNPIGGRFHSQKAYDALPKLQKWLQNNATATSGDRAAVENLIYDLHDALEISIRPKPKF